MACYEEAPYLGRGFFLEGGQSMTGKTQLDPSWTRINVYLPVNSKDEMLAATSIIEEMRNKYGGATHSTLRPHAFEGYWWDHKKNKWFVDRMCWLTVDVNFLLSTTELDLDLEIIKTLVDGEYTENNSAQDEVWIIVHPVLRFMSVVRLD